MKALLLIPLLAVSVSAQKIKEGQAITNWTPVGVGVAVDALVEGDKQMEMSFANVRRSEDKFRGWVRFVFPSSAIVLEGRWNEARFYVECDCRKNSLQVLSGIAYGVDGSIRAEQKKIAFSTTEPGTMGRQMFEFFCERGGPPSIAPTLKPKMLQ